MKIMTENERNLFDVIEYVRERGKSELTMATDEDVDKFIELFMEETTRINKCASSYGLKHVAERVIGHLFYGSTSSYAYVSNDKFKERMHKKMFFRKETDPGSPNEYYAFKWKKGVNKILDLYNQL